MYILFTYNGTQGYFYRLLIIKGFVFYDVYLASLVCMINDMKRLANIIMIVGSELNQVLLAGEHN